MAGISDIAKGETGKRIDSFMLSPKVLVIDPNFNIRNENDDPEVAANIRAIADEIKQNGITYIPALTIYMRGDEPVVTDGYCRTRGALLAISEGAEVPYLPVRPEERGSDETDRTFSLLKRNEHGLPLTPLQQAKVVKRLIAMGKTDQEIADRSCKSIAHIKQLIILLSAPIEVKEMVKEGKVSASHAVKTVRKEGEGAAKTLGAAIKTAEESGRKRATAKHMPKEVPASAAFGHKESKAETLQTGIAWNERLVEALTRVVRANDEHELQTAVIAGEQLLKDMGVL